MGGKEREYTDQKLHDSENKPRSGEIVKGEKKPKSLYLKTVFQSTLHQVENQILQLEVAQLRAENEVFSEKEERRRRQVRKSAARKRNEKRDEYNTYKREYMREWRARKKRDAESKTPPDNIS